MSRTNSIQISVLLWLLCCWQASGSDIYGANLGNFGLPGTLDMPIGEKLTDGEVVISQSVSNTLVRTGLATQVLPNLGLSFHYSGQGNKSADNRFATGRVNHDRSFDAHLTILNETQFYPSISVGLRDFIGTGWYSSEYVAVSKNFGQLQVTGGLGFGRLAGKRSFENPLSKISSNFRKRERNNFGRGGTLGTINWFQGDTSMFYSVSYRMKNNFTLIAEYSPDLMEQESDYLDFRSHLNYGINYRVNNFINLSAQYLYGSTFSINANIFVNPNEPPYGPGLDLAPVPMRVRTESNLTNSKTDFKTLKKVLTYDGFKILNFEVVDDKIRIDLENTKFRSVAQAIGRVSSTLQRFTAEEFEYAIIVFHSKNLQQASYKIDLNQIFDNQHSAIQFNQKEPTIKNIKGSISNKKFSNSDGFAWDLGPYITHRLFNPDLPLSAEVGAELTFNYPIVSGVELEGSFRKSILTNLTKNKRKSNSVLPRVQTDWPVYDIEGQDGHIHELKLSYLKNLTPYSYLKGHAGFLEPFYAGIGGEFLYKPPNSSFGIGFDVHYVQKRDYDMLFQLQNYATTTGHVSLYYDAGGFFNLELNAGKYLARDLGATLTVSRVFGSGWEFGAYSTITDVPFETFGEGSFDKGIYISIPLDWITGKPNQNMRYLNIRPITRDGGARLTSARSLYKQIKANQNASFLREQGRLWK